MATTTLKALTEKAAPKAATPAQMGKKIDAVFALRKKKVELEAAVKDVEGQIASLDSELLEMMQKAGVDKTSTKSGTVSVSTSIVANVTDWDAFYAYIYKNKFGHLLQRRVSDPAWRELQERGKKVPGTEGFEKTRLNYRAG